MKSIKLKHPLTYFIVMFAISLPLFKIFYLIFLGGFLRMITSLGTICLFRLYFTLLIVTGKQVFFYFFACGTKVTVSITGRSLIGY